MKTKYLIIISIIVFGMGTGCKLSVTSSSLATTANTGTVVTLTVSGNASDIANYASKIHGAAIQIPEDWTVLSAAVLDNENNTHTLTENTAFADAYLPESGKKVWGGVYETFGVSGDFSLILTVKLLTGDFYGNPGTTRTDTIKFSVGAYRNSVWEADDPADLLDFSAITSGMFVKTITLTKVDDVTAPASVSGTQLKLYYQESSSDNRIVVDWSLYNEASQGDVTAYHLYYDTTPFTTTDGMSPIQIPAGQLSYELDNVESGRLYYVSVNAVDEQSNEAVSVNPRAIYTSTDQNPCDINNDGKYGLEEAIRHLQIVVGFDPQNR